MTALPESHPVMAVTPESCPKMTTVPESHPLQFRGVSISRPESREGVSISRPESREGSSISRPESREGSSISRPERTPPVPVQSVWGGMHESPPALHQPSPHLLQIITWILILCTASTHPISTVITLASLSGFIFTSTTSSTDPTEYSPEKLTCIGDEYVALLQELNSNCATTITLFDRPLNIKVGRRVKQGDTISPKLFTACLEQIFRQLNWDEVGIKINGRWLNHLRFADDIVLIGCSAVDVQQRLDQLNKAGARFGLKINLAKTKWMRNDQVADTTLHVDQHQLQQVDSYIYLGQELTTDHKIGQELARRRRAAWVSFGSIAETANNRAIDPDIRAALFNSTVLPGMLYGAETWTMTAADRLKLAVTERAIERRMIGVQQTDHVRNEQLRAMTRVDDAVDLANKAKKRWAGHLMRRTDERWTREVTVWLPVDIKRPRGRPATRWRDSLRQDLGHNWMRLAQDRQTWADRCGLR
ncbi:unnamed protein product [Leuciscus chuanchicus]